MESVIGKTLSVDRKEPMSIRGVFEDMGENADIHFDVVVPMSKLWNLARGGWGYDISYMSIIRFRDPAKDIKAVEARIPDMLKKYMADSSNKKKSHRFSFRPLSITATRIPHNLKKKRNTFVRNTSCKSATASMDNRRTSRAR